MIVLEGKLAKKYALAFLNVYKKECTDECMDRLAALSEYVAKKRIFQATLNIPSLPMKTKEMAIEHVVKKLQLSAGVKKLIHLLLKEKRIDLLDEILRKILFIYKKRVKEHHFTVTISHELSPTQQKMVISFIEEKIPKKNHNGGKVSAAFVVDPTLISGIKIEGSTFRWERSISKELRSIEQKILRQEILW